MGIDRGEAPYHVIALRRQAADNDHLWSILLVACQFMFP